ncbi:MAG: transmembrane sensor [Saprospiraceae bacterium]|jgi:transmembrane sensor
MSEDFYISLIYKKITGSISEEEGIKLEKWINESEEHNLTAQSIILAWNQSGELNARPAIALDEAFNKLEERINNSPTIPQQGAKIRGLNRRWLSIAAGIAILLIAGIGLYNYWNDDNVTIYYSELRTDDKVKAIVLLDNTRISLNKNSFLKYPKSFSGKERRVILEGEAFFEVTHNPDSPFIVETKEGETKVLGTSFNVRAYPKEAETQVQLVTGRVQFEAGSTKEKVMLTPGNQAIFNKESKTVQKLETAIPNKLSWHTRRLEFVETPLSEVLVAVEKLYGVKFELENTALKTCPFNATFEKSYLETVTSTIAGVFGIEVIRNNNIYLLKGGKCE